MLDFLFFALQWLLIKVQPVIIPCCFIVAWGLVALSIATVWSGLKRGISHAQTLHQIPCSQCQFFTEHYALKCTVHPHIALSEAAINCRDYEEQQLPRNPRITVTPPGSAQASSR